MGDWGIPVTVIASMKWQRSPEQLAAKFAELPQKLQNRGMRRAQTKAAKALVNNARPRIPRAAKKQRQYAGKPHYQDSLSYKVKTYKTAVVAVAGPRSGSSPHAHLVEEGTQERYTKRTTQYRDIGTKRTKATINGKRRFINRRVKKSIGSFVDVRKAGVSKYRGRMPAFRPLQRAFRTMQPIIRILIRDEMRASIAKGGN